MVKNKEESWWNYIRSFEFWQQIALMILIAIVLTIITLFSLRFFTHHGQKIKVPDMSGYTIEELQPLEDKYSFKFVIRDSVFDIKSTPGTIIAQTPKSGSIVKKRRTFYVIVSAYNQPSIKMPNLIDLSYRQAVSLLETYGLKVGSVTTVNSIAEGAILGQFYKGRAIAPNDPIAQGSSIDLQIGSMASNMIDTDSSSDELQTEGLQTDELQTDQTAN